MKKISLVIIGIFITTNCYPMSTPIMSSTAAGAGPSTTATNYTGFHNSASGWGTTENQRINVVAVTTTFKNLRVALPTAPDNGAGVDSYQFILRYNGTTDSALTCTISDTETSCTDLVNSVTLSPGDWYVMKVVPANTPASSAEAWWSAEMQTGPKRAIITAGTASGPSNSATNYAGPSYSATWNATEGNRSQIVATAGTIDTLFIVMGSAPGSGTSFAFTLMKNGVAQSVTCTVADTATACNDVAHSFTVAAGDNISIRSVPSTTPTTSAMGWGIKLVPNEDGESTTGWRLENALSTASTNYLPLFGVAGHSTTEGSPPDPPGPDMTATKLYAQTSTSPGAGKSYVFTYRIGTTDSSVTCPIDEGNTTCNDVAHTSSVTGSSSDRIRMKVAPNATPTSASCRASVAHYMPGDIKSVAGQSTKTAIKNYTGISYQDGKKVSTVSNL